MVNRPHHRIYTCLFFDKHLHPVDLHDSFSHIERDPVSRWPGTILVKKVTAYGLIQRQFLELAEQIIRAVIAGKQSKVAKELKSLIFQLKQQGATHIILGCTELSVAMDEDGDKSLIDPLSLVVDEIIMKRSRV